MNPKKGVFGFARREIRVSNLGIDAPPEKKGGAGLGGDQYLLKDIKTQISRLFQSKFENFEIQAKTCR
ncbi:MAG: hypothetical protein Q4F23_04765 [Coriobacteriia bacterium]|nr:hypothetical protein [Coriobacteriia bacterium]